MDYATLDIVNKIASVVGIAMLIGSLLCAYKRTGDKSLFTKVFPSGVELTGMEKVVNRACFLWAIWAFMMRLSMIIYYTSLSGRRIRLSRGPPNLMARFF